jgi:hypothetical protein
MKQLCAASLPLCLPKKAGQARATAKQRSPWAVGYDFGVKIVFNSFIFYVKNLTLLFN